MYVDVSVVEKWATQSNCLPSSNLKRVTSYAAALQNTLKLSLAASALALDTLYYSLKRRKKTQKFSFAPWARRKNGRLFVRRAENVSTF